MEADLHNKRCTPEAKIPWAKPDFWGREEAYLIQALHSSWISGGPFVERLEGYFAEYSDKRYALAVSNGTTALHLAFLGLGLSPGDEVIIPGFAFLAAANVALHMGARPVFVEVDPETWCMDPAKLERCITNRTRIIVPVHTYGNICAMDEINEIARTHKVAVVEDAAEAFASTYRGRQAGSTSMIGTYSFQATKTITTGEGGMVVTNDPGLQERMALYRSHGMAKMRYWHELPGHNFRLTNLQAALGCAQFEALDRIVEERRRVHANYAARLQAIDGIAAQKFTPGVDPVLWAMAVKLDTRAFPQGRDVLMKQMASLGIETRPGFYAASLLPIYETPGLPVCEDVSRTVVSLPTFPSLSEEQVDRICKTLNQLRR